MKLLSCANVCFKLGPKTSHAMLITAIIKTLFIQFSKLTVGKLPFLLTSEICFKRLPCTAHKGLSSQGVGLHVPSTSY